MDTTELELHVHAGHGVVGRFGRSCVVALHDGPRQLAVAEELLELVSRLATDGDDPGRTVARSVAGLIVGSDPEQVPHFAVVTAMADQVVVLIHGGLDVEISAGDDVTRLSGADVATWLDRVVGGPFDRLTAHPSGAPLTAPPPWNLEAGSTSGTGFTLVPAGTPRSHPAAVDAAPNPDHSPPVTAFEPAPSAARSDSDTEPLSADSARPEVAPQRQPEPASVPGNGSLATDAVELVPLGTVHVASSALPVGDEQPTDHDRAGTDEASEGTEVLGVMCSRQHFNDPDSRYCASCGIAMVHRTHRLVRHQRPPLGVLVRDDGASFAVDTDYVIGREPEEDEEVRAGRARPLPIDDPGRLVSRVHARISLRDWAVRVSDASSVNGTYIKRPDDSGWTRLPPDEPTTIPPRTSIRIGDSTLLFDTHAPVRGDA